MKTTEKLIVKINILVNKLKLLGYSVNIKNTGDRKIMIWSTRAHWASIVYSEDSQDDLLRLIQRLKETIYNIS